VACVGLGSTFVRRDLLEAEEALTERGRSVSEHLAYEAELSVLSGDVETLRRECESARAQRDLRYCRVVDAAGAELVRVGDAPAAARSPALRIADSAVMVAIGKHAWEFEAPVVTAEIRPQREEVGLIPPASSPQRQKRIGVVSVGLGLEPLRAQRRQTITTAVLVTALVTTMAVLMAILLASALTRPLKAVVAAADAIAKGDLGATVDTGRRDEVGVLADSFNAMARSLERSHAALEESNHDLEEKVRARTERLEAMNRELEEANRLKSEFLATVSHELRTPLNVIIGYTGMLGEGAAGPVSDEQQHLLGGISRYSRQLLDLITSVLDFSRLTTGRVAMRVERFELAPMLDDIQALHAAHLADSRVALIVRVAPEVPTLETDRVKLQEVIRNLVDNAVKFTSAGMVTVQANAGEGGRIAIEVRDTGCGIAPEELPYIFDEFRQIGDSRTRDTGGVGLGLSIVKRLVDVLGGTIAVSSTLGVGSTFRVEVPARIGAAQAEPAALASDRPPSAG
jgi:two-component system sensor histidine kinase BarA